MTKFAAPAAAFRNTGRETGRGFGQPGFGTAPGRNTQGGYGVSPTGKANQPHQETGLTRRKK